MKFKESEIGFIRYAHENDYNYLVLLAYENEANYKLKMIEKNNIKGLLSTKYLIVDEEIQIKYNISSKVAFHHYLEKKHIDKAFLFQILESILNVVEELKLYLLDSNQLVLKKEFVFMNMETHELEFCYTPYSSSDFVSGFKFFIESLLEDVDYDDKEAIEVLYGLHTWGSQCDFSVNDLKEYIQNLSVKYRENTLVTESSKKKVIEDKVVEEKFVEENLYEDIKYERDVLKKGYFNKIFTEIKRKIQEVRSQNYTEQYESLMNEHEQLVCESAISEFAINEPEIDKSTINETVYISEARKNTKRSLISLEGKQNITIVHYPFIIGKLHSQVDALILEQAISRLQSKIDYVGGSYYIEDLNSKNGTYVNDERIEPYDVVEIKIGDRIGFAEFDYIFR